MSIHAVTSSRDPTTTRMVFTLNDQQQESVDAMIGRESSGLVHAGHNTTLYTRLGINGNIAGSGKTRSMLALVHADLQRPHMNTRPYMQVTSRGVLAYEERKVGGTLLHGTTIILANGSIRRQWIKELDAARCMRYTLLDNIRKLATFVPAETDVAIVSNTVYKKLTDLGQNWRRFIYDETDSYIFPGMHVLHASFTWFVTATWETLDRFTGSRCGRIGHNHAIRHMLCNVPLRELVVVVPCQLGLPPIEEYIRRCRRAVSIVSVVSGYVEPDVMLQIESGNIQGAIQSLGGDSSTTNIVDLVRSRLERSLREAQLRMQLHRGTREVWTQRSEQIQRDILLVNERFQSILSEEQCSVCMEGFSNPVLTPCHHVFCLQCLVPWFEHQHTCPQCRTPVHPDQTTVLIAPSEDAPPILTQQRLPAVHTLPTRMEHLEETMRLRRPEQRILIFSESDESLSTIQSVLVQQPYSMLSGHSSTRDATLRRYKAGELPILLLNSRMNGAGLDLPETTDIILFHTMHESLEKQAIGRGQRLGRTAPLRVHRFV